MTRLYTRLLICISLAAIILFIYKPFSSVHAQPPYAKWGKIAVQMTKEKYPQADIIDYLHIGRRQKTGNVSVEKFKLWLRDKSGKEFGVFVDVEFDVQTEKFINISFKETPK
ncbi:YqzG/YhdC family protein [Bacillus cytotoxicus]|uniref:YqzG/YhdC family protein n=1 Tax=Bacillus cytotoxicus TaxID=580165 RepID=A0ACC6A8U9_9BACI|nr:YqzG/YhdC family protein [Bacillus cytotoxicus]HDX9579848.1 YqzG/YhdC family protein [Bacillus pseudomycoides]